MPFSHVILGCIRSHLLRPLGVGLEQVTYYGDEDIDSVQLTTVESYPDVPLKFSGGGTGG